MNRVRGIALLLTAAGIFASGSQSWALASKGLKIPVGDDPSLKEGSPRLVLIEVSDFQ